MAVLCPAYDPVFGWYVIVFGPNGPKKRLIVSPLHYYHKLGVTPPVGATFSTDDYLDLEDDLLNQQDNEDNGILDIDDPYSFPVLSSDPYELPPVIKVGPPKSSVGSIIPEAGFLESFPEMINDLMSKESNSPLQYAPIIPEAGVTKSSLKVTNCPPQYAPIIPEAGFPKSSLKATNYLPQYAPIIPEVGVSKYSLKATNYLPQYAPIIPEAGLPKPSLKATNYLPQYAPIIPEAGLPKPSLKATNCPPQYAPIIPEVGVSKYSLKATNYPPQYAPTVPEVGVPKSSLNVTSIQDHSQHAGLIPDVIVAKFSETNEPTFYSSSPILPSMYTPEFSSLLHNHYMKNPSSFEPQPSTSNMFQDAYSPDYSSSSSSFDKNLMSSVYDDYDEEDDYNMATAYDDPYGKPHNM